MVRDKPTLDELASRIRAAVEDQDVIIYNASFDASLNAKPIPTIRYKISPASLIRELDPGPNSVQC